MKYYIDNGHALSQKNRTHQLCFVIHTHRSSSAIPVNEMMAKMIIGTEQLNLKQYNLTYKESIVKNQKVNEVETLELFDSNIKIHFRRGFTEELVDPIYKQADILFSYSMVGGLSELLSSSMFIPNEFIPLDEKNNQLHWSKRYTAKNHLLEDLPSILSQPQENYFDFIKKNFNTKNPEKNHQIKRLTIDDFIASILIQVTDLWHPLKPKPGETSVMIKTIADHIHQQGKSMKKSICAGTFGITKPEELQTALRVGYREFDLATAYKNASILREAAEAESISADDLKVCMKINDGDLLNEKFQKNGVYSIETICDQILNDLNAKCLDTLMLHSPALLLHNQAVKVFEELIYLKKIGKINHIGVSNFTVADLMRLDTRYLKHIDINSIEINPFYQRQDVVDFCQKHQISIMPYRPFGKGKVLNLLENEVLNLIANNHGVTVQQVILGWMLQQNMLPIAKAGSEKHLLENLNALNLELTPQEMQAIASLDGKANDYNWVCGWKKFVKLPNFESFMDVKLERSYVSEHRFRFHTQKEAEHSVPEQHNQSQAKL